MTQEQKTWAETRATSLRRDARFVRRTAQTRRAEGRDAEAARLFVLAGELERAAHNQAGRWWWAYLPGQLKLDV